MDLGTYFEKFKGTGVMVNGVRHKQISISKSILSSMS
jgi:hypothetical protein